MAISSAPATVNCELKDKFASIVFNNPDRHNAMSLSMWQQLGERLDALASDADVRAVVLSGAGQKAFVSGADISEFAALRGTAEAVAEYNSISESADKALAEFPKPTIAKIRGYCIGGGMGLALGCDIRVCSDDASFAIPAGKVGLGYSYRYATRILRAVGQARASEILYTSRRFNAEQALQMGLVNKVVPTAELDSVVDELLQDITANAPLTLTAFKAAAIHWAKQDHLVEHSDVAKLVEACFASEDYLEGQQAFKEKRKPKFKSR